MSNYPTAENFYDAAPDRIFGTENEYHIGIPQNSDVKVHQQDLLDDLGILCASRNTIAGNMLDRNDVFTELGSRIYNDLGHTEIATAESLGPFEAALTEHAGAHTIGQMAYMLRTFHGDADPSIDSRYPLRRAATYHPGHDKSVIKTKGYHQNMQVPVDVVVQNWNNFQPVFSSFLAAKALIFGAGFESDHFSIAQKMFGIGDAVTTRSGGISATGDGKKPLAAAYYNNNDIFEKSSKDWAIVEIRSSDPSMNPHTTYLDLAASSLCLRLFEHRLITRQNFCDYSFAYPVDAARTTRGTVEESLSREHSTLSGEFISLPQMLGKFALAIDALASKVELPKDEQIAVKEWCSLVENIIELNPQSPDIASLPPAVEWAHKQQFLDKHSRQGDPFRRVGLDMLWSNVGTENTYGKNYFRSHEPNYRRYQEGITTYTERAPANTRAHARAEYIKRGIARRAGWASIITMDGDDPYIDLPDAYNPNPIQR